MIQRILRKDLKRRKSVNIILFLFIMIASIFLSSSINNIMVVSSAVNYYMDYANVPDVNYIISGTQEKEQIDSWIEKDAPGVKEWGYNTVIMLNEKDIRIQTEGKDKSFNTHGASMYLGTKDADYCKVYDTSGKDFSLEKGEIALGKAMAGKNKLEEGSKVKLSVGGSEKLFTVKLLIKDAAFGSDMAGMSRMIVCPADYEFFSEKEDANIIGLYYFNVEDVNGFVSGFDAEGFVTSMNSITKSTYTMAYSFDMIMAGLLILIGICLILIALLVLRFTLVFTIEEEYREIGIMKAMGLRNFAIKKLYLIKYILIVVIGAAAGLGASIPVSRMMVASVSGNMIMEDTRVNLWVNGVCTLLIVILVMFFCYSCTRKLNKISAISAIRGGQSGERYGRRAGLRLYRRKRMPVALFLGINDMASHVKRYLVLIVTFCLSFILITIPLNTLNTMKSDEMAGKFCMDPKSSVYVEKIENYGENVYRTREDLDAGMKRVETELAEKGYEAELTGVPIYFLRYSSRGETGKNNIMTVQIAGPNQDFLSYQEGDAPRLSNEVAFSRNIMEQNGWQIGDTVEVEAGGEQKQLIITGTYSDYMQVGKSARMNPKLVLKNETMFHYWNIMVDMETDRTQEELVTELSSLFPHYQWTTAQEVVDRNVGGIQESLKDMLVPMTGMLCAVIMLITLLMERLFIVREKGEIAMMKSIGYRSGTIRLWQVMRMVWVALISMIAAVPLSLVSNRFMLKPIFAIMGADVEIQVVPWQVYGVYPGVLLVGIILATVIATMNVKKINIRELNNLE
ncbi:FtsX-like permease family protein [Eubacterium sp. BIOML-A1]|uniref:Acidobacterial duplicated orphan permease n=2 Tax=Clostridia TaxID=186801 RepID=A0A174G0H0_9FIRM|nr:MULTISPECIES: ABC transporter permease [Clostridia]MSC83507.1 FtsX-like permease family protein [Eubacterium sp. BIOML-A1]CUO55984.1 acidobacterial duplicated orphan permease [[Eubacterium] contortum] [Faecalicatena contorta]